MCFWYRRKDFYRNVTPHCFDLQSASNVHVSIAMVFAF